jgi:hypothetical protein
MTSLYRFYIAILVVEWVFFGSMHFSAQGSKIVISEMPDAWARWGWARPLAIITGMIEIAVGFFLVPRSTRRWAAMASFLLLIAYAYPVYKMVLQASDPLNPPLSDVPAWWPFISTFVVPNNLFLGIASWRLWRDPIPPAAPAGGRRPAAPTWFDRLLTDAPTALVATILLIANCAGFVVLAAAHHDFSTASLWAMMCIVAGALLGFLFGVPRVNRRLAARAALLPNTNIEEISDWATKMIVGIGVANFRGISDYGWTITRGLAAALGSTHEFAMGLVGYFVLVGIVQGYLLTRMFLAREFVRIGQDSTPADADPARVRTPVSRPVRTRAARG